MEPFQNISCHIAQESDEKIPVFCVKTVQEKTKSVYFIVPGYNICVDFVPNRFEIKLPYSLPHVRKEVGEIFTHHTLRTEDCLYKFPYSYIDFRNSAQINVHRSALSLSYIVKYKTPLPAVISTLMSGFIPPCYTMSQYWLWDCYDQSFRSQAGQSSF